MLRTLTGATRRKFSFDLALHRSREKKQDDEAERARDQSFADTQKSESGLLGRASTPRGDKNKSSSRVSRTAEKQTGKTLDTADDPLKNQSSSSRRGVGASRAASLTRNHQSASSRQRHNKKPTTPQPSSEKRKAFFGPDADARDTDAREAVTDEWLNMREARRRAASPAAARVQNSTTPRGFSPHSASRATTPRDAGGMTPRGRLSARGDDAPRIRELSRDRSRDRAATTPGGSPMMMRTMTPQHTPTRPQGITPHQNSVGPTSLKEERAQQSSATAAVGRLSTTTTTTSPNETAAATQEAEVRSSPPRTMDDDDAPTVSTPREARAAPGTPSSSRRRRPDENGALRRDPEQEPTEPDRRRGQRAASDADRSRQQQQQQQQKGPTAEDAAATPPKVQARRPLVLQEPPSWQQLKTKALEADYASMVSFFDEFYRPKEEEEEEEAGPLQFLSKTLTPSSGPFASLISTTTPTPTRRRPPQTVNGEDSSFEKGERTTLESSDDGTAERTAQTNRDTSVVSGEPKNGNNGGPTFEKWFTERFPENQIASAPAAHRALWAEHERQRRVASRGETPRRGSSSSSSSKNMSVLVRPSAAGAAVPTGLARRGGDDDDDHQGDDGGGSNYLDRLRAGSNGLSSSTTSQHRRRPAAASSSSNALVADDGEVNNETAQRQRPLSAPMSSLLFKSGSVVSPGRRRDGGATVVHVVTWRVERWSALPSGFRQGARYRPPGGAPWSLDLYKGGIKKERPGMIALYVHYDAPLKTKTNDGNNTNGGTTHGVDAFATVTSLELSLMNQTTGAHLLRKHEGTRVFGPKADQRRRVSTSAGTASLAHLVLTQVEALGFCVADTVVLRAEIEVAKDPGSTPPPPPPPSKVST